MLLYIVLENKRLALFIQPRYVVNRVTAGDYDCPRKVLKFLTDLHAAFRMLNLRNDFLRKKFDGKWFTRAPSDSVSQLLDLHWPWCLCVVNGPGMKYDLRKVEEVYYDVKIRGLATSRNSEGEGKETEKDDES